MNNEIWKIVPEHPGYEASSLGRIRSVTREVPHRRLGHTQTVQGQVLSPNRLPKGYRTVMLEGQRRRCVHTLVLEAFVGPRPKGMQACHNDGNPDNNRLDNLRWDTRDANERDKQKHGTYNPAPAAKLTARQVKRIKLRLADGHSLLSIAESYRMSLVAIERIQSGTSWRHLTP